jgi:DNA-binding cell septation regulator SpoVG
MDNVDFSVRVYPIKNGGDTKAFAEARVYIDGEPFSAIRGIRVVENINGGQFVSMPQSRDKEGRYKDVAFLLDSEQSKILNDIILENYNL